jgi:hypothetical protein
VRERKKITLKASTLSKLHGIFTAEHIAIDALEGHVYTT